MKQRLSLVPIRLFSKTKILSHNLASTAQFDNLLAAKN